LSSFSSGADVFAGFLSKANALDEFIGTMLAGCKRRNAAKVDYVLEFRDAPIHRRCFAMLEPMNAEQVSMGAVGSCLEQTYLFPSEKIACCSRVLQAMRINYEPYYRLADEYLERFSAGQA
jgi:hypothetical protein